MMRNQNKKTRNWKTMLVVCILRRSLYIYLRLLTTRHFVLSYSPRQETADFTRFNKDSTRNIFTFFQPQTELVFKMFLTLMFLIIWGSLTPVLLSHFNVDKTSFLLHHKAELYYIKSLKVSVKVYSTRYYQLVAKSCQVVFRRCRV